MCANPPDHLEPHLPPMSAELLDGIAFLMVENDALRARLNMETRNGRLKLTADDRRGGHSTGPRAFMNEGDLIVDLEC